MSLTYHYEDFLTEKLNLIKQDLGMNINLEVYEEQIFVKMKTFTPNTIYVIIKYLSSNITLEATLQPVQIMILSEQNSMEMARTLFNEFANRYNWITDIQDNIYTKHQYSTPVVLSNFEDVSNGYNSMLYVSGTLAIMENVLDIKNLKIDNKEIPFLSFNMSYSMNGNTQQMPSNNIASTIMDVSTIGFGLTIALKGNPIFSKIFGILSGRLNGDTSFNISFTINDEDFTYTIRLTSSVLNTAPNQVPSIQLGFKV